MNRSAVSLSTLWLALTVSLLYAAYFVLRYGGLWTENDTSVFSLVGSQTVQTGNALFSQQYAHGFGYPAWMASLSLLTGLPVPVLNTVVLPYAGATLLVLTAFLAYRSLLGSVRASLVAVALLFAVPDLMFSVLRGNHEKLTIVLMLAALYALFKGFAAMERGSGAHFAFWVLLFYALVFTNATVNDYFASTFALASTLTLASAAMLSRHAGGVSRRAMLRFALSVAVSWLLVWFVILFVFPPAAQDVRLLATVGDRIRSLFLTLQASSNPYSAPAQQWATPLISAVLAVFRWILFAGSFAVWIVALWPIAIRRKPASLGRLFLLSLYGAFGLIVAVSIPVDFTNLYAGTNLELRNFTPFALLVAPLLATFLDKRLPVARPIRVLPARPKHRIAWALVGVAFSGVVLLGLLKGTLDPIVSNQWLFYSAAEHQSLTAFARMSAGGFIWTGPDNRLPDVVTASSLANRGDSQVAAFAVQIQERDWLRSPQIVASARSQRFPIPPYNKQNRIYDNGGAQIYRKQPRTPFQN